MKEIDDAQETLSERFEVTVQALRCWIQTSTCSVQIPKGREWQSGGKRKRPKAPNFDTHLRVALARPATIRSAKRRKTYTKGIAGIYHLVDQWAKGDRHARRDLILLCNTLGVDLTDREALEDALEDALSAQDEALLADFVRRHGGQYPVRAEAVPSPAAKDQNLLSPPADDPKLLTARTENSTSPQTVQPKE
jgi:hypothetical protein